MMSIRSGNDRLHPTLEHKEPGDFAEPQCVGFHSSFVVAPSHIAKWIQSCRELEVLAKTAPGCRLFHVMHACNDCSAFEIYSEWDDASSFVAFQEDEAARSLEHSIQSISFLHDVNVLESIALNPADSTLDDS